MEHVNKIRFFKEEGKIGKWDIIIIIIRLCEQMCPC